MRVFTHIPVKAYKASGFIKEYQELIRKEVIPYQYRVLWDKEETAEKSHVAANFINAAAVLCGKDPGDGFYGMVFQDSDAYKWLEAVAYSLIAYPDSELEKKADEFIRLIEKAQDKDGYLNTYYTIKDQDKRWTNLLEGHELYCSGHLIEAACAYYEATGKNALLNVACRNAEYIYKRFIEDGQPGIPGHPEIELALMRLYRATKNEHFLKLSLHFINERGINTSYFSDEAKKRSWTVWNADPYDTAYNQSNKPLRELSEATGHAVRAVYLYTAMADLAAQTNDSALLDACERLWKNITERKMYITGGIGQTVLGEAFTVDYDLPSDTAYAETCASIGLMFFAEKMLENKVKGDYADIEELAFYNTVLAGIALDGKSFFYVNPLEADPGISGVSATKRHDLTTRPGWYACACCPPNAARLIGAFGKFAYGESDDVAYCHMFAAGAVSFSNGMKLTCTTAYPYDMKITLNVSGNGHLAVHIPGWSQKTEFFYNGISCQPRLCEGYAYFDINGEALIELSLDSTPHFVRASCKVPALAGMTALMRGPLVYCFEGTDNGCVRALKLDTSQNPSVALSVPELKKGIVCLQVNALRINSCDHLYSLEPEKLTKCLALAVPYYTWGNRGENEMRVWMNTVSRE